MSQGGRGIRGSRERLIARLEEGGRYPRWVLVTALVGMFSTTFPVTILTVSLGDVALDFGVSETVLAWVISAPLLASAVAVPILGKMGDLYGHRKVFVAGFAMSMIFAAFTAAAWNPAALIGLRTASQVVGAATQPTSMALVMAVFAPRDRAKALGYWSLVSAGAPAVGLVVGGPLVEILGWRVVFVLQAALAAVALAVAAVVLKEAPTRSGRVRFDVAGSAALAVGVGATMLILSQGPEWGWTHPAVLAAVLLGPAGLLTFVAIERRVADPLLPLRLFRQRNFTAPMVCNFFSGSAYMGGFILTPLLMRFVLGFSLSATALLMVLRPLSYSLASPLGGHLSSRVGERVTAVAGTGSLCIALVAFAVGAWMQASVIVLAALFLQGVGNGVARPPLTASVANAVDASELGVTAALGRMSNQIGASFGIALVTGIYAGQNAPGPFTRAYVFGAVMAVISVVSATMLRSEPRDAVDGPAQ